MQAGSLAGGDVRELTSRVLVNGVERAHESWSTARDIVGDLPEQVVAGGGVRQATGAIVWAEQSDVSGVSVNPWNASTGWLPKSGDWVVIRVGDGVTEWVQFNGRIDEVTGYVGGQCQSSIVGFDDHLNRQIEHSTVFATHPPTVEGGSRLGVAMGPGYVVDRAMRACGYFATPPMRPGVAVSVPAQLSMWPEFGFIRESVYPNRLYDDYGWWVEACSAIYVPQFAVARTTPVELTMMVSPTHAGSTTLAAEYDGTTISLKVDSARTARAYLGGAQVCSLALGADMVVSLRVRAGAWTIKTKSGQATGSAAVPAGAGMSGVRITGSALAMAAGFQVSTPAASDEFGSVDFSPNFNQRIRSLSGTMGVLRSYELTPAIDVISEISKATLTPFWIDELGQAKMVGSDVLRLQAPVQSVTTLDDITKLSWQMNTLDTRSKVIVKYKRYAISRSIFASITFWQGSGESMASDESKVLFATEPDDEDWAEVGVVVSGLDAFNRGRGTWVANYVEDSAGTWAATPAGAVSISFDRISNATTIFTIETSTLPAGKTLVLGTPEDASNYSSRMQGFNMPVLRGRGKAMWADASVTSAIRGPTTAPELVHDTGHWVSQDTNEHQLRIADFIASQVTAPKATITGMEVIYDPRRQLGDVITISSPSYMGVELDVLIVGVRNSAGDQFTQSLDVRIITAKSTFTTYAEYNKQIPDGLTYQQWQTLGPLPQTYEQFNDTT